MKIKRKLKRKKNAKYCECGCGQEIIKEGNRYILGHGQKSKIPHNKGIIGVFHHLDKTKKKISESAKNISKETKRKMSLAHIGMKHTEESKRKMSLAKKDKKLSEEHKRKISIANKNPSEKTRKKISQANLGRKHTDETKLKIGLAGLKCRTDGYCDAWSDNEYKKNCRKNYCENIDCNNNSYKLILHHIDLDKKNCCPDNFITLCVGCHLSLHRKLYKINNKIKAKKDDFIILIEIDKIKYIHKEIKEEAIIIGY